MKSIKDNFLFKISIFVILYLLLKELTYLLIEDYFVIGFRFYHVRQVFYCGIFISIFVIFQIFIYHVFVNIYKNTKIFQSLLLFIISLISSFYISSMFFYAFSDVYSYDYMKYFLINWGIISVISYWLPLKAYIKFNNANQGLKDQRNKSSGYFSKNMNEQAIS